MSGFANNIVLLAALTQSKTSSFGLRTKAQFDEKPTWLNAVLLELIKRHLLPQWLQHANWASRGLSELSQHEGHGSIPLCVQDERTNSSYEPHVLFSRGPSLLVSQQTCCQTQCLLSQRIWPSPSVLLHHEPEVIRNRNLLTQALLDPLQSEVIYRIYSLSQAFALQQVHESFHVRSCCKQESSAQQPWHDGPKCHMIFESVPRVEKPNDKASLTQQPSHTCAFSRGSFVAHMHQSSRIKLLTPNRQWQVCDRVQAIRNWSRSHTSSNPWFL